MCGKEGNWIHHKWHLWFSFPHHRISCLLCWLCAICDRDGCSIFGEPTLPSLKLYNFAHRQIIVLMLWSLCWQSKDLIRPFICSGPLTRLGPGTVLELMIYWFQFDPTLTIVWLNNWCRPSLFEYWKEIRMKGCWSIKGSVKCVWQTQWGVLASVVKANMRFRKISLA